MTDDMKALVELAERVEKLRKELARLSDDIALSAEAGLKYNINRAWAEMDFCSCKLRARARAQVRP